MQGHCLVSDLLFYAFKPFVAFANSLTTFFLKLK